MSNIKSITSIGKHQTYDLEVGHRDHQFYLANGVLTSNSHAVAYAIDSYWCSWLLTYYEEQWLTSYIESMSGTPEKKAKAFAELKRLGYTIVPIDINYAGLGWTILPGKKFMPSLLSCKGVGEAAADEIIQSRPYSSIEEVLWNEDGSWKPSKFNKKAMESLIKVGAFQSLDCVGEGKIFESYKHMHEVLVENSDAIKKSPKKDPQQGRKTFYELARALRPMPEWSRKELAELHVEIFGSFDVSSLVDEKILQRLQEMNVNSVDDWDQKGYYWFSVQNTIGKKTKTGKNYLVIEAVGPQGKTYRINAWGWDGQRTFDPLSILVAEVDKNDFGYSTTLWRCKELS